MIDLPYGGAFDELDLITEILASGRDYIIQGQEAASKAVHTKPSSLDYWVRRYASNPDTKQAENQVIDDLVATGRFVIVNNLICPDTGEQCKGVRLLPTRDQHLRRVVLVCCHFARNFAYYRAGWDGKVLRNRSQFWVTVNGNSFDTCVLEWCKLFVEPRGEHHWSQVVTDPKTFETYLYDTLGKDAAEFERYRLKTREYRDKFVAHLDLHLRAYLPYLDLAWASVRAYHEHVVSREGTAAIFRGLPLDIEEYRAGNSAEANAVYRDNGGLE